VKLKKIFFEEVNEENDFFFFLFKEKTSNSLFILSFYSPQKFILNPLSILRKLKKKLFKGKGKFTKECFKR